jgi:predicted nucleic acid-binding protein
MIILDTNVVSELMRPRPEVRVQNWARAQSRDILFTTAITQAEVFYGIEIAPVGKRREQLREAAQRLFLRVMSGRVLEFDGAAAEAFSQIAAKRRKIGRPISYPDAQIAGIAKREGATLATRNINDFDHCGIRVINPWMMR